MMLIAGAVALLSFANGANDNFKGVATLWGAGRTSYQRALAWATLFTFLGSLAAIWAATGLVAKFNGSKFVAQEIYTQPPFLAAVALAATATVLLASRLGLPISTTHAMTGALVGAGVMAAGIGHVQFAALGGGVLAPLLFSPVVALGLTLLIYPLLSRMARTSDCICVDEPRAAAFAVGGSVVTTLPALHVDSAADCQTGAEMVHWNVSDTLLWLSGAAISFARGLNDTPKIAAVLLVIPMGVSMGTQTDFLLVALMIAIGGIVGATRVAQTMSKKITAMGTPEAVSANLVAAALVTSASFLVLPVSTTHVTSGGIFGIALLRRSGVDWRRVRDILLSWVVTLPAGAAAAASFYWLLTR